MVPSLSTRFRVLFFKKSKNGLPSSSGPPPSFLVGGTMVLARDWEVLAGEGMALLSLLPLVWCSALFPLLCSALLQCWLAGKNPTVMALCVGWGQLRPFIRVWGKAFCLLISKNSKKPVPPFGEWGNLSVGWPLALGMFFGKKCVTFIFYFSHKMADDESQNTRIIMHGKYMDFPGA